VPPRPSGFTGWLERQRQIVYLLFGGAFATFGVFGKISLKRGADYSYGSRFAGSASACAGRIPPASPCRPEWSWIS